MSVCAFVPTRLSPVDLVASSRRADVRVVADVPETRADRDAAAMARADADSARRRLAAHAGHLSYVRTCDHCRDARDARDDAARLPVLHDAQLHAQRRAADTNARKVRNAHPGDVPARIGPKVRTTRNVTTPTLAGDRTANGTRRNAKATQRYAHDAYARNVGDTRITNLHDDAITRIVRNASPLTVRMGGGVNIRTTLLLLAYYRHALACRNPRTRGTLDHA